MTKSYIRHFAGWYFQAMKKMYAQFGITYTPCTYEDIIKVCNEVAGTDLSKFFSDYISGVQVIPLDKYPGYAGLERKPVNGQTFIEYNVDASGDEKDYRNFSYINNSGISRCCAIKAHKRLPGLTSPPEEVPWTTSSPEGEGPWSPCPTPRQAQTRLKGFIL